MNPGLIRPYSNTLIFVFRFIDAALLSSSLYVSVWCCGYTFNAQWGIIGLLAIILFSVFAEVFPLYRSWRTSSRRELVSVITIICFLTFSSLLLINSLFEFNQVFHRSVLISWISSAYILLLVWRGLFQLLLFYLRRKNFNSRSAIIVGATESGLRLRDELTKNIHLGIRFLGFFDDRQNERQETQTIKIHGSCSDALSLARQGGVDYVYIALPFYAKDRTDYILTIFADTTSTVFILPNFYEYQLLNAKWHQIGVVSALSIYDSPFRGIDGCAKRLFDIFLSMIFLILLSLPMFFIALLVKLSSKGPAIFTQQRYGLDGEKIEVYKFRTMTTMDNGDEIKQASRDDSRCTPLGRVLRSISLDELPQLINVLQGKMSIVGPRPHAVAHNEEYRTLIRGYMLRHKVKPGITGWAQVNGWRGETESIDKMEARVKYDLDYINNWSLYLDVKIIFMTIFNGCLFSKDTY